MAEIDNTEELAIGLYSQRYFRFLDEPITLRSGGQSHMYYNQRGIMSVDHQSTSTYSEQIRIRNLAAVAYIDQINDLGFEFEHLYPLPQAMTLFAGHIGGMSARSTLWERAGEKSHGSKSKINGSYHVPERVLLLDDAITSGSAAIESKKMLTNEGIAVTGLVAMMDRESGGLENLKAESINAVAIFGLHTFVETLSHAGVIGSYELDIYNAERPETQL